METQLPPATASIWTRIGIWVSEWPGRFAVALIVVATLAQIVLFHRIWAEYFPSHDEIAMLAGSTGTGSAFSAWDWWLRGLHGYFVPYPEWDASAVDYWRPAANAWYWLCDGLFQHRRTGQLLLGYMAHAAVIGTLSYIAFKVVKVRPALVTAGLLIALLNPAYILTTSSDLFGIPRALQFPAYQIEVITALVATGAILAHLRQRYVLFSLLALVAVLLKETALVLPLAALMLEFSAIDHREERTRRMFWLILPLFVWLLGRLIAYRHGADHLANFPALKGWVGKCGRNLLLWPTGLFQDSLATVKLNVKLHQWNALATELAALVVNLLWWLGLWLAISVGYRGWRRRRTDAQTTAAWVMLVFALSNLLAAIALPATEVRYGYLWFAVGPLAMFVLLSRRSGGNGLVLLLTVSLLIAPALALTHALGTAPLSSYQTAKRSMRQLTELMPGLSGDDRTVYLLDDLAVQSASPDYFARFAGFQGRVVLVNNLAPLAGCERVTSNGLDSQSRYRLSSDGASILLEYERPECFDRAWNVAPLDLFDSGHFIQRGTTMSYHFPELTAVVSGQFADRFSYEPGAHWSVRLRDPACASAGRCLWVGLDAPAGRYYVLQE